MSSSSAVVCREIFDENSQPSAEEVSDYAHQIGIDVESESHLLPLAKDGLMQALPSPWKAYFDEKLQTHYYYNEESKQTQWEHPLDQVYRDLVRRARDEDTCASVQELLTSEEYTKNVEKYEAKINSEDEDLSTDSENGSDIKESSHIGTRRPLSGRPPLAPLTRNEKKLRDIRNSPLRRSIDSSLSVKPGMPELKRPFKLFKQQSEIIDLKMHVLNNPEEDNFSSFVSTKPEKGLALTGKGTIFLKAKKPDLPSPDTEKSITLEGVTKSDPPKGILRDKPDPVQKKAEVLGRPKLANSFEDDRKSVRFNLENSNLENTVSPSSNSSSSQNEGQSVISSPPVVPSQMSSPNLPLSPLVFGSPNLSLNLTPHPPLTLAPLITRPPLPPRPPNSVETILSPRDGSLKSVSVSEKESFESDKEKGTSPRRRVVRPPPADYIKPELFQKNFQKISDLVRPGDIESSPMQSLNVDDIVKKESRPRSPMIPQMKNKISINLMESIDSETSIDSPDKEFANLDLNEMNDTKDIDTKENIENNKNESNVDKNNAQNLKPINNVPQIRIPKLELLKAKNYNSDDEKPSSNSKDLSESKTNSKSESLDLSKEHTNQTRVLISPQLKTTHSLNISSYNDSRSPRNSVDLISDKFWSTHFKPVSSIIKPVQVKSPDNLNKVTSPRLDGVILSQNKNAIKGSDNVVVMYQFETNNSVEEKPIVNKCRVIDSSRDVIEKNKMDERKRLELVLNKELDEIREEWNAKEKVLKAELVANLKEAEEAFCVIRRKKMAEQAERHRKEIEEALQESQRSHEESLKAISADFEDKLRIESDLAEDKLRASMAKLRDEHSRILSDERERLQFENEHAMADFSEHLSSELMRQRAKMIEENRANLECLREEHLSRISELRHDYRTEIEHLRSQQACHLEEVRGRLAGERAALRQGHADLHHKYRGLKEKYERLKHDVKMSLERRNKRRELSMTTGSETEKSNSHKATQSADRSKESNEHPLTSVVTESDAVKTKNNNPVIKCTDNETSISESNTQKSYNDNNNEDWKNRKHPPVPPASPEGTRAGRRSRPATHKPAVGFRDPPRGHTRHQPPSITTDCQDSSDATTADEKPKESLSTSHGRRRCFTRLKSASTSRLNYSPKRGEGWSSPLESLRQQLRKLDDLEDQFPDLACQPAYSLRYPFGELGGVGVISKGGTPELEFVRHRALIEREGMRRARAALRRRRDALSARDELDSKESTELEIALHRARALLGEKEIRLRHIEKSLKLLSTVPHAPIVSQEVTSSPSSSSEAVVEVKSGVGEEEGGAVLRSLRALHADVRDIWRALDARNAAHYASTASPETSSCLASTSQRIPSPNVATHPRITLTPDKEVVSLQAQDASVTERARGLRAWLQAP